MDGVTGMPGDAFYRALRRTLPRPDAPPWNAVGEETYIHLCLFVHRVEILRPGLYFLVRDPADEEALRRATRSDFVWSKPSTCPKSLPLYLLVQGDFRRLAAQISCTQDIAGDSAFSLGMIARFKRSLDHCGDWIYPRLFWEAGMVGQVLYLEAEASGLRGTGIGCFFDDAVHELLGIDDTAFQSLYHFTVGGPVTDRRLRTLPPYPTERIEQRPNR